MTDTEKETTDEADEIDFISEKYSNNPTWAFLYSFNENISEFFLHLAISYKSLRFLYVGFFILYLIVYPLYLLVLQSQSNLTVTDYIYQIIVGVLDLSYFVFEFLTMKEINDRLNIWAYSFNIYCFVLILLLAAVDYIHFEPKDAVWDVFYVLYFSSLYPLLYINMVMTLEMVTQLTVIKDRCSQNEKLSLTTFQTIHSKSEAMRNTTMFYTHLSSLHKLMEFKVIVIFLYIFLVTVMYFIGGADLYLGFLFSVRFLLSAVQPLYLQYVIQSIEAANHVFFGFTIKVFGTEINTLMVTLPIISYIVAIVQAVNNNAE
jgi:hypothetical protein